MTDTRTPEQIADEMAAKYFKAKKPPRAARKNGHHHEAPPIEPDDPGPTSPENYGGNNRNRDSEATLESLDNLEDESDHASKATYREGLPELLINDADPTATAKQLAALIAERGKFLSNGYAPVQIVVDGDGLPRALEVSIETVRVHGHEACNPTRERHTKTKGLERIAAKITTDIARLYLYGLEGRWGLKPFRGITTSPILQGDSSIRVADGYDDETGLWCHNIPDVIIPDEPTERDAKEALYRLRHFFRTFPFADGARAFDQALGVEVIDLSNPPGLDESSFLLALLTAVCRQSLDLAPAHLCDAPAISGAGNGKGLLQKAICVTASGIKPSAFTSGHDPEEFDKRLTAALVEAHPSTLLDNFNGKELTSDILASVLTESPAMVRPMGHTKMVPLHTRTFIAITGNAVEISEDMARRIIKTQLDAHMEDPEQRPFEPGFLDRVLESREALLSNVLTIWRWGRQNKLKPGKPFGSYEKLAHWCRDPLLALGARDPVDRIAEIKAADPRRRAVVTLFEAWWTCHGDNVIKAADLADAVAELIDTKPARKHDGSPQYSRQRLARYVDKLAGTRLGGYALIKLPKDQTLARPPTYYKLQRDRASAGEL